MAKAASGAVAWDQWVKTLPDAVGGVGKSYLTAAFAQWLVEQGRSVACIDADTLNPTLLQYAPLKATHLKPSQSPPEVTT